MQHTRTFTLKYMGKKCYSCYTIQIYSKYLLNVRVFYVLSILFLFTLTWSFCILVFDKNIYWIYKFLSRHGKTFPYFCERLIFFSLHFANMWLLKLLEYVHLEVWLLFTCRHLSQKYMNLILLTSLLFGNKPNKILLNNILYLSQIILKLF